MNITASKKQILGVLMLVFCSAVMCVPEIKAEDQKYNYDQSGRRDPFVPLVSPSGYLLEMEQDDNSVIRLEGILYDAKGESMAILNGELVRVGESVGDTVLTKIEREKVIVMKDNQSIEIELRREE